MEVTIFLQYKTFHIFQDYNHTKTLGVKYLKDSACRLCLMQSRSVYIKTFALTSSLNEFHVYKIFVPGF